MRLCPSSKDSAVQKLLCLLLFTLCALILPEPLFGETEYLRRAWLPEEGAPGPGIRGVMQGHNGYLWLASDESLRRFDGVRFVEFDKKDYRQKSERWMAALVEDRSGNIWASGCNGGLIRLQNDQVRQFTVADGLPHNHVLSACADRDGNMWAGTSAGIARFEGDRFVAMTNISGITNQAARTIVQSKDGSIWIGFSDGLCRYKDGEFSVVNNLLPSNAIYTLREGRDGTLYVGTLAGLAEIKDGRVRFYTEKQGLAHNTVRSIYEDSAGNVWIGTHGGLQRLINGEIQNVVFRDVVSYERGDSFSELIVYSICEDREGNIWAGTSGGLHRFHSQEFKTFTTEDGLTHNQVTCGLEDRFGAIWMGTMGGGLNCLRDGKLTSYGPHNGFPSKQVLSLYEDKDNALWIGTDGEGLVRYKDGVFIQFKSNLGPAANRISMICEDLKGGFLIGSGASAGILRFNDGKFTVAPELKFSSIKVIHVDKAGGIWLGSQNNGLIYSSAGKVKAYTSQTGLSSDWVNAIYEDVEGTMWIGLGLGGLNRLKDGKISSFKTPDGPFEERVLHILEDHIGNLWMGTRNGIFMARKKDLNDFAEGRLSSVHIVPYGRADGLKRSQCNGIGQPAGWKSRDLRLWFPLIYGAVAFNPEQITSNQMEPPVVLEDVKVAGKRFEGWRSGEFPAGGRDLEFNFTGLSLNVPEKVRFRYKLDGVDSDWQDAGTRRLARYAHLKPGKYTFHAKAANDDGFWNEKGISYTFTIAPHFYETAMFYAGCGVGMFLIAAGLWRLRGRRMQMREKELLVLVSERTKELQQEVTDRETAERRAMVFSKLGQKLSLAASQEQAARIIVEAADELIGWDSCSLSSYNAEDDKGRPLIVFDNVNGTRQKVSLADTHGGTFSPLSQRAIKQGPQLVLRDTPVSEKGEARPFGDISRLSASLMFVPIRKSDAVVGVVSIQSYKVNAYNQGSLNTLQALADYCGGAFERIRTEEALRESQQVILRQERLAAVGQLSAGVAHEFNNILTIIRGHATLLLDTPQVSNDIQQSLGQIVTSSERAANLTRQMLAFSRKQVMQARVLDLNEVCGQVARMLSRFHG